MAFYEEEEDDEIFTRTNMWDFAYRIAQDAMAAAFQGKKNIDGLSLEQFIDREIENEAGS